MTKAGEGASILRDGTYMKQVHEAWIVFSREFEGRFPTPALVAAGDGAGDGGEYEALDTTANLHGLCIMMNYYSPEICVGPTEPSEHVYVCDDYNWEKYDPAASVYWDASFKTDLDDVSHISYASMPLFGERYEQQWRESYDSRFVMIGNRGPRDGVDDPTSITYQIHSPGNKWTGNITANDNHLELIKTFFPNADGDNIFAFDEGVAGADAILTITNQITPEGPVVQHD